ncbi:MAG: hypothetical protein L0H31_02150 [Nocardioidaceae bacterium]|uniref:hypothetical protein n=1 Tax=Corynebacterium sp. TaxID=1720 RepID=UPI0026489F48|nr:hypothetical protein [Corynebacterium sp.]MDN5723058.1 hypothetical protein [Corynebacterium sp.]MDN5743904.1 hypothetical protein [Nocardioidaceae bacterium]
MSTRPPSTRPPSTLAQRITAVAAVVIALTFISSIAVTVKVTEALARGVDTVLSSKGEGPIAIPQAVCLTYSKVVIDLHKQGLAPHEIQGVLDHAKRSALQDRNPTSDDGDTAIESREMCGSPADVLRAGGMGDA